VHLRPEAVLSWVRLIDKPYEGWLRDGCVAWVFQVEFYFGDDNLPTDAFMIKQVTSNAEGWGTRVLY
jgi:hypothetical protein